MKIPPIIDFVRDENKVHFLRYQGGNLWYRVESISSAFTLEFPVPVSDTGEGIFLPEDRAMPFMRWIRKQVEVIKAGLVEAGLGTE